MKYMGSKRSMLLNGLGELLKTQVARANGFADLFAGSAAVAIHVACKFEIPVHAFDLQNYSAALGRAVLERTSVLAAGDTFDRWKAAAVRRMEGRDTPPVPEVTVESVRSAREWAQSQADLPITCAYGGHYFSPIQSVWLDALRLSLPKDKTAQTTMLSALIQAASQCVAAPGHTAQPFQPTETAKEYLADAWKRSVIDKTKAIFETLCSQSALRKGKASVSDAGKAAEDLEEGDLAFIDPPYSGVHYSRFYHVLETVAVGECGEVEGVGRYPATEHRPMSAFSVTSKARKALNDLFETVASRQARAIVTFPNHECSNGLSGEIIREVANQHFIISEQRVSSRFSTMGGTGDSARSKSAGRSARHEAQELMLVLRPRRRRKPRKPGH